MPISANLPNNFSVRIVTRRDTCYWLALKDLLQYTPIKPKSKSNLTPTIPKGKEKAKADITMVKPKGKNGKKQTKSEKNEKAPKMVQVWVPKGTFALT